MQQGKGGIRLAGIAELVEQILLELPIQDILFAQRVNHTWCGVIQESLKLQRALFFKPISDDLFVPHWADDPTYVHDSGKSVERATKTTTAQDASDPLPKHNTIHAVDMDKTVVNPFLEGKLPWLIYGSWSYLPNDLIIHPKEAYSQMEASWRKMLVTQAPFAEIVVQYSGERHRQVSGRRAALTLGDLLDATNRLEPGLNIWNCHELTSLRKSSRSDGSRTILARDTCTDITAMEVLAAFDQASGGVKHRPGHIQREIWFE